MAEIRLETKPVAPLMIDTSYDHLYLVFVDDIGNEFVIRGGLDFDINRPDGSLGDLVVEVGREMKDSDDSRPNTPEARDARGSIELDLDGRDAEAVWSTMIAAANAIALADLGYMLDLVGNRTATQNSNSVVAAALARVGIDVNNYLPLIPDDDNVGAANTLEQVSYNFFPPIDFETGQEIVRDDILIGGRLSDILMGGEGEDTLMGGDGDDFLFANRDMGLEFPFADEDMTFDENFAGDPPRWIATAYADGVTDYLYGGRGMDHYFVAGQGLVSDIGWDDDRTITGLSTGELYNYTDIIYDTDGRGRIWYGIEGIEQEIIFIPLDELPSLNYEDPHINSSGQTSYRGGFGQEVRPGITIDYHTDEETGITADRLVFYEAETKHVQDSLYGNTGNDVLTGGGGQRPVFIGGRSGQRYHHGF